MFSLASFDLVPWDLFIYLLIGSFFTMEGNESIPSVWRLKAGLIGLCRPWMNFLNFYFMAGTGGIRFFSERNLKLNRRGRKKRRWKRSHKLRTNWKRLLFNCPMEGSRFVRFSYSRLKKKTVSTNWTLSVWCPHWQNSGRWNWTGPINIDHENWHNSANIIQIFRHKLNALTSYEFQFYCVNLRSAVNVTLVHVSPSCSL